MTSPRTKLYCVSVGRELLAGRSCQSPTWFSWRNALGPVVLHRTGCHCQTHQRHQQIVIIVAPRNDHQTRRPTRIGRCFSISLVSSSSFRHRRRGAVNDHCPYDIGCSLPNNKIAQDDHHVPPTHNSHVFGDDPHIGDQNATIDPRSGNLDSISL